MPVKAVGVRYYVSPCNSIQQYIIPYQNWKQFANHRCIKVRMQV